MEKMNKLSVLLTQIDTVESVSAIFKLHREMALIELYASRWPLLFRNRFKSLVYSTDNSLSAARELLFIESGLSPCYEACTRTVPKTPRNHWNVAAFNALTHPEKELIEISRYITFHWMVHGEVRYRDDHFIPELGYASFLWFGSGFCWQCYHLNTGDQVLMFSNFSSECLTPHSSKSSWFTLFSYEYFWDFIHFGSSRRLHAIFPRFCHVFNAATNSTEHKYLRHLVDECGLMIIHPTFIRDQWDNISSIDILGFMVTAHHSLERMLNNHHAFHRFHLLNAEWLIKVFQRVGRDLALRDDLNTINYLKGVIHNTVRYLSAIQLNDTVSRLKKALPMIYGRRASNYRKITDYSYCWIWSWTWSKNMMFYHLVFEVWTF